MSAADFRSDNTAGASPEILAALAAAAMGSASSYGMDCISLALQSRFSEIFERDVLVHTVVTGTAGNCLALASITPSYGAVFCHRLAHINTDECGGPEFFTGGAKLILLEGDDAKVDRLEFSAALEQPVAVHQVQPSALSLSQLTESGALYEPQEIATLAELARAKGLAVHMDGARFANAVAALGRSPAEMTWKAGVDILSFGATKNGALMAEAVIFFNRDQGVLFERLRKRAGHLLSKMRFVSAQLMAYLEADLWLRNAAHANAMAQDLVAGLSGLAGVRVVSPVPGNQVFIQLPQKTISALQDLGFLFYSWGAPGEGVIRLVTSFATTKMEVESFLSALKANLSNES